jgi:hypothetical protein
LLISIIVFQYLLSIYEGGDFNRYETVYNYLESAGFTQGFGFYRNYVGGIEIGYYIVANFFSSIGVSYYLYKVILSFALVSLMLKNFNANSHIALLKLFLLVTNFYLLVLITEVERLGVALIVFLFFLNVLDRAKTVYTGLSGSLFASLFHLQFIIISIFILFYDFKFTRKKILYLGVFFVLVAFFGYYNWDYLFYKISYYIASNSLNYLDFLEAFLILTFLFFISRKAFVVSLLILPFFLYLFGLDRIVIFPALYCFYKVMSLSSIDGKSIYYYLVSLFSSYKGYLFIVSILETGRGY